MRTRDELLLEAAIRRALTRYTADLKKRISKCNERGDYPFWLYQEVNIVTTILTKATQINVITPISAAKRRKDV